MKKTLLVLGLMFLVSFAFGVNLLDIQKSSTSSVVTNNVTFTWVFNVTSTANVHNVSVWDTLPTGFTGISAVPTAVVSNGVWSWSYISLSSASQSIQLVGKFASFTFGNVTNTVSSKGNTVGAVAVVATSQHSIPMATPTIAMTITAYGNNNVDVTVNTFDTIKSHLFVVNGVTTVVKSGSSAYGSKFNIPLGVGSNIIQYTANFFKLGTSGDTFQTTSGIQTVVSIGNKVENIPQLRSQLINAGLMVSDFQNISVNVAASSVTIFASDMAIFDVTLQSPTAGRFELWQGGGKLGGGTQVSTGQLSAAGIIPFGLQFGDSYFVLTAESPLKVSCVTGTNDLKAIHYIGAKLSDIAKIK